MVSLCETLSFLHGDAGMAHCGLSPLVIMVTGDGAWRLSGFAFSVTAGGSYALQHQQQQAGGTTPTAVLHSYADPYPPLWEDLAKVHPTDLDLNPP